MREANYDNPKSTKFSFGPRQSAHRNLSQNTADNELWTTKILKGIGTVHMVHVQILWYNIYLGFTPFSVPST